MEKGAGLDQRSFNIIKALVDEYVRHGAPVASHTLAAKSNVNLSPASVRNVLSRLEEMGLIEQVHTSSGRRPTVRGLHIYLNRMLRLQKPSEKAHKKVASNLRTESASLMAESAMGALGDLTQLVTMVSLPNVSESKVSSIQFMRLSSKRVVAVLVTADGEVRNRLLELPNELSQRDLELASQFFNEHFSGKYLAQAREQLSAMVGNLQASIVNLLQKMLATIANVNDAEQHLLTPSLGDLYSNSTLVSDSKRLRDMVALLHRKETLLRMLDQGIKSNDVTVFIGVESGIPELEDSSLIVAPYGDEKSEVVGVLGLIGPINMKYGKVMPIMEMTTSLMQKAMVKIHEEYS